MEDAPNHQPHRFAGKSVLVTGASGGIGRAICGRFAAEGANVAVHFHRGEARAQALLEDLPGGPHMSIQADITDPGQVAAMVETAAGGLDGLDILVNNAGIFERHPPLEVSYEEWQEHWRRTLAINLVAAANTCFQVVSHMRRRGGGRIINISSRGAFRGEPENPAYGASKAGLNALSQSLALALGEHGICVYAVAPGFVETAMARPYLTGEMAESIRRQSPLGRVARAADVAYWVTSLAAEGAEFATGAIIDVNGASYLRS